MEALAAFAAAGIELVSDDEFRERFQALNRIFSGSPAARAPPDGSPGARSCSGDGACVARGRAATTPRGMSGRYGV